MSRPLLAEPAAEWIEIGGLDDFLPRGARVVKTAGGDIAIFRSETDELFALDNRCPHRNGPLSEGIISGDTVACPLHNWVISLRTGRAAEPDEGCVATLPVRVENGRVYLGAAAARARR